MFTAAHVLLPCHSRLFFLLNFYDAETLFVVASVTAVTELSLVDIVPAVTIDTRPVFITGFLPGFAVTGMTMKLCVGMPELE
jgi:hypothetical protein